MAAEEEDIFHGLVIDSASGRRFVPADQVAQLHERGVDLRIEPDAVAGLAEPHGGAPELEVRDPTAKMQRTRWKEILDMLSLKGYLDPIGRTRSSRPDGGLLAPPPNPLLADA